MTEYYPLMMQSQVITSMYSNFEKSDFSYVLEENWVFLNERDKKDRQRERERNRDFERFRDCRKITEGSEGERSGFRLM